MTTSEQAQMTVMEAAVAAATLAPSVHNTQPWRFHIAQDRIEIFVEPSRQLTVLDPTGRQLHISCGAALHHLQVALRSAGYAGVVDLFPAADEQAGEQLATVVVTEGEPADEHEQALAAAIPERHSQREPFADRRVAHETLTKLRAAAEAEGAWLAILEEREDQITLAVLQSHADRAELDDPAYHAELHAWRRTAPATDGIPTTALPAAGPERHSEVTVRDFGAADDDPLPPSSGRAAPPDERPALVILGTDADSPEQWVKAGQALSHLLLEATVLGLRASVLGQVIDLSGTRGQLRPMLRLVGEPQMVLRVGYGPPAPATPRRPLSEVLS